MLTCIIDYIIITWLQILALLLLPKTLLELVTTTFFVRKFSFSKRQGEQYKLQKNRLCNWLEINQVDFQILSTMGFGCIKIRGEICTFFASNKWSFNIYFCIFPKLLKWSLHNEHFGSDTSTRTLYPFSASSMVASTFTWFLL